MSDYREAFEAIKETIRTYNQIKEQALEQYTALVDSAIAGCITNEQDLEHLMDGLLDFGDDLRFLEVYRRLCCHIFDKHPEMVKEHTALWKAQFMTNEEET